MGYVVSSLLAISESDPHQAFIYYLPARWRLADEWVNDWIYDRFQEVAARLGPNAVLIAPPRGAAPSRDHNESLNESFREALGWMRGEENGFLHEGLPLLVVSRRPVVKQAEGESINFAAIDLASLDEARLAQLFDGLIEAARNGDDLVDSVPDIGARVVAVDSEEAYAFRHAVELKPRVFGMGFDGNLLLDWLESRKRHRARAKQIVRVNRKDRP